MKKGIYLILITLVSSLLMCSFVTFNQGKQFWTVEVEDNFYTQDHTSINRYNNPDYEFKSLDSRTGSLLAISNDAQIVAKVLYGMKDQGHYSDKSYTAVVWVIENRMDSEGFPNTVKDICSQKNQFIGYSEQNPVEDKLYRIAYVELLKYFRDGERGCDKEYCYLTINKFNVELKKDIYAKYEGVMPIG